VIGNSQRIETGLRDRARRGVIAEFLDEHRAVARQNERVLISSPRFGCVEQDAC
jgi:hypothetical protein